MYNQKRLLKLLPAILALIFVLTGCQASAQEEADSLLDQGLYQEAMSIYETLEQNEEIDERISQCRYYLFAEYLRDKGSVLKQIPDKSAEVTLTARENGEIKISFYQDFSGDTSATWDRRLNTSITYKTSESPISGTCDFNLMGVYSKEETEGVFDLGTYHYGSSLIWDSYETSGSTIQGTQTKPGLIMLEDPADILTIMIKSLEEAISESDTGVTMSDLGFSNL